MMYPNVKTGLNKVFWAEILTIVSSFAVSFNGEDMQFLGTALGFIGVVAFFLTFNGLKQCTKDEQEYKKAYNFSIVAIFVCLAVVILGVVADEPGVGKAADNIQSVFNYLVAYQVLKATAKVLRTVGKEPEAVYADKTRNIYTFAFIVSELLSIGVDTNADTLGVVVVVILALVAVVALLVANIRYLVTLKRSADAL